MPPFGYSTGIVSLMKWNIVYYDHLNISQRLIEKFLMHFTSFQGLHETSAVSTLF